MFTFGSSPINFECGVTSNGENTPNIPNLESNPIQHTIHHNSEHHSSSGYCSYVSRVRPDSTRYDPLNHRQEKIESIDGRHIKAEKLCQRVVVQNERAAAEQSERCTVNTSGNNTRGALDLGLQKKILLRKNKNQTPRLSRISLCNSQNNRRTYVKELPEELHSKCAECQQRLPTNCYTNRDENTNNLEQGNEGYKDFVIHNSETDFEAAKAFRQQLLNLGIPELTVDIFELIDPEKTEMESLSLLHERYKIVLLFVTKNYSKDKFRRRQAEILMRKSSETEALSHWVVPVWIEKDAKMQEWALIKGIKYHLLQQNKEELLQQVTDLVIAGRRR